MKFDKDEIKNSLSIEQIEDIVAELGGEPKSMGSFLTCRTICHGGDSHKLYYYDNTKLFKCFTECDETFDIFELILKIKKRSGEDWSLYNAMIFVVNFFSLDFEGDFYNDTQSSPDWQFFSKWSKSQLSDNKQKIVDLKIYDDKILSNLPQPRIINWEREGITREVCLARNIRYDPKNYGIVIPHYNIDGQLVGIRERTVVKKDEIYGKYKPAILNGKMYNHPLGYNLYNLNYSKKAIHNIQKAIVFEGEKSSLLFASYFGVNNDISVACCGSSLISYQVELLLSLGVQEIIIGFDKQYKDVGDKEWKAWTKKLYKIHDKYGKYVQISYLFDKGDLLGYKDSPIDKGQDIFLELFKNRIII